MRIPILFTLLVLFSLAKNAAGQQSKDSSTLYISAGANRFMIKDEFESPYTFRGTDFIFHLAHVHFRPVSIQIFDLNYSRGTIHPTVSPSAKNSLLFLSYDYLLRIQELPPEISISLGGGLSALLNSITYLPDIEQPDRYVTGGISFDVSGRFSYNLNDRSRVGLMLGIPIVGIAYRPDFEVDGQDFLGMNSIIKNAGISGIIEYEYNIGPYYALMARYLYTYFTFPTPRTVSFMQNALTIGANLKF